MDITAAAFLEGQPMLQLIGNTVGMQNVSGGLNPGQVRSINKAIRGVQVSPKELPVIHEACPTTVRYPVQVWWMSLLLCHFHVEQKAASV